MKGEAALGAVNLAFPMQFLMTSVAVGTGIGINSLVSRRLGEGRKQEADKTATYSLMLGIFSWLIFLLLGIFAVHPLISVFTNDPETYQYSVEYLSIVFIFSIGIFVEVNTGAFRPGRLLPDVLLFRSRTRKEGDGRTAVARGVALVPDFRGRQCPGCRQGVLKVTMCSVA